MSVRPTLTRAFVVICGLAAVVAMSMPAADAKEFGSDPSATADLHCDDQNYFAYWYTHLANSAAAAADAHFEVKVDALAVEIYDLKPGTAIDQQLSALDGIPSHITVKADGNLLLDTTSTVKCRQPSGMITAKCDQQTPTLEYYFQTISSATVHFELHEADGSDQPYDLHYDWKTVVEQLQEDQPYDVWILADGKEIAWLEGTADCKSNTPPTTTPPTTTPPTTPPATTPPTVVSSGPPATDPPAAVTPTTTAAQATLPYTGGGNTLPLLVTGLVMILAGGSTVIALRRRATA